MAYTIISYKEKLQQLFPNSHFELLSFSSTTKPCVIKCLKCNKEISYTQADKIVDRARRGIEEICIYCANTSQLQPRLKRIREYQSWAAANDNRIIPLEDFKDVRKTKIKWLCNNCKHSFDKKLSDFLKNPHCPWCETLFSKMTLEIAEQKTFEYYGDEYTILSKEYNPNKKLCIRHNLCGFTYNVANHAFLSAHEGCPRCKSSHGERKVRKYLEKHNIPYIEQYRFYNSYLKSFSFDFFIDYNGKKSVIEYNGKQHYEPISYFGGEEAFSRQQERDNIKKRYCKEEQIDYIEIPYNDEHLLKSEELAQRLNGQVT